MNTKEGTIVINTNVNNTHKSKVALQLYNIDFDHLISNSLDYIANFLQFYLDQGEGNFYLPPLGINNNLIIPNLTNNIKLIGVDTGHTIYYDGQITSRQLAHQILTKYLKHLKRDYDKQQQGDLIKLHNLLVKKPNKLLFSRDSYENYLVQNLDYLTTPEQIVRTYLSDNFIKKILIQLGNICHINSSAVNALLDYLRTLSYYKNDINYQTIIDILYKIINDNYHIKMIYDQHLTYINVRLFSTKTKLTLPINMIIDEYSLGTAHTKQNISIKIMNQSDLNCFITDIIKQVNLDYQVNSNTYIKKFLENLFAGLLSFPNITIQICQQKNLIEHELQTEKNIERREVLNYLLHLTE